MTDDGNSTGNPRRPYSPEYFSMAIATAVGTFMQVHHGIDQKEFGRGLLITMQRFQDIFGVEWPPPLLEFVRIQAGEDGDAKAAFTVIDGGKS